MPLQKKTWQVNKKLATNTLFPATKKIKGIDWIGNCRCVSGADLSPVNFILRGGSRHKMYGDSTCLMRLISFSN